MRPCTPNIEPCVGWLQRKICACASWRGGMFVNTGLTSQRVGVSYLSSLYLGVSSPHLGFRCNTMLLIYKILSTCIHQQMSFVASQYPGFLRDSMLFIYKILSTTRNSSIVDFLLYVSDWTLHVCHPELVAHPITLWEPELGTARRGSHCH